ncbi:hypothetical protein [Flavobacterium sp. LM4]|uniref:hypothetical protein n=1 Tax=Flavobacterium sp. LM4 TaxID=1938609 RepID=UPI000992024A|nr:hypothetical protein [Flavobacterium sp. LM4]OOV20624.1 hypothetical protein BXU10_13870 [Flavobacterium sp. LM4]
MKIINKLSFLFLFFLVNCNSQEKIENTMNTEERISHISSKIKKYDYEPLYQIEIETLKWVTKNPTPP